MLQLAAMHDAEPAVPLIGPCTLNTPGSSFPGVQTPTAVLSHAGVWKMLLIATVPVSSGVVDPLVMVIDTDRLTCPT